MFCWFFVWQEFVLKIRICALQNRIKYNILFIRNKKMLFFKSKIKQVAKNPLTFKPQNTKINMINLFYLEVCIMKKVLSVLLILSLIFSLGLTETLTLAETKIEGINLTNVLSQDSAIMVGDVDLNGEIDAADALVALQYSVSKITLNDTQKLAANVDAVGSVNSTDALLILQYSVNKIDSFPAGDFIEPDPETSEDTSSDINDSTITIETNPYDGTSTQYFKTTMDEVQLSGPITAQQTADAYSAKWNFNMDMNMVNVFESGSAMVSKLNAWAEINDGKVAIFTPVNRGGNGEYYAMYPEREGKDEQRRSDGTTVDHPTTGARMIPTEQYVQFRMKFLDSLFSSKYEVQAVVLEEPEIFLGGTYSEGFKEEWVKYYGTPWEDYTTSTESEYRTHKLIVHLFTKAFTTISEHIKSISPNTKFYITSHSSVNYEHHSITSGFYTWAKIPTVDGIIGQTWLDTANTSMAYNGSSKVEHFLESLIEYAGYAEGFRADQHIFTLGDPASDDAALAGNWSELQLRYQDTLAAQLMFSNIRRFQTLIWPSRAFGSATPSYQTVQLNNFNVVAENANKASELYSGTQGVYVATSDTMTWQEGVRYDSHNKHSHYSLTLPLAERGIIPNSLNIDMLDSIEDMKKVKLLIMSYEYQKPLNETINKILSQWVKDGGTIIYIGAHDSVETITTEWWSKKGQTPLSNLLYHLGLGGITLSSSDNLNTSFTWKGNKNYCTMFGNSGLSGKNSYKWTTFGGSGYTEILSNNNQTLGIEAKSGKGNILCFGMAASWFSDFYGSAEALRQVVNYALSKTDTKYLENNLMLMKRGNLVVANTFVKSQTIYGNFIDLTDSTLPVIYERNISSNKAVLLYDITEAMEKDVPTIAVHGGNMVSLSETETNTQFVVNGPSTSTAAFRILCNGYSYKSVSVLRGTAENSDYTATYDADTDSLLFTLYFKGSNNYTVNIEWE